ncbi:MAG: sulfatase [Rhodothermales bacterium]
MHQLIFTCIVSCLLIAGCQSQQSATHTGPPNVVLIFADDLGYGDLSIYGHPTIHTPRLDEMAREGIKMTSFYTAAPVCTPSRAGLLTGRYPIRFGLPGNLGPGSPNGLPQEERTLAEALKEQGYRTAAFGKWHLGSVEGYFPTDHGFDEYFGLLYSNDMLPPWVNTDRPMHLYRNKVPTDEQPVNQHTITKRYTEEAIKFIKASKDQPFFVYLPHSMPHLPVYASDTFKGTSKGGRYGDVIEELDWSAGAILDALAEEGLDENTLFIFTSDNGPWRNMPPRMYTTEPVEKWHGGTTASLRGAKATSFDGGSRVPAILRWPGHIPAGQVNAEIATTMDLHATILKLAGATSPPKPLDGLDIWPLLTDGAGSPHDYHHYFRGKRLEAVRDAEWKLRVAIPASNWSSPELQTGNEPVSTELFNMMNDPFEQFDLSAEHPQIVERLRNQMITFAEETGGELQFTP